MFNWTLVDGMKELTRKQMRKRSETILRLYLGLDIKRIKMNCVFLGYIIRAALSA
jgi:hypothetical protein